MPPALTARISASAVIFLSTTKAKSRLSACKRIQRKQWLSILYLLVLGHVGRITQNQHKRLSHQNASQLRDEFHQNSQDCAPLHQCTRPARMIIIWRFICDLQIINRYTNGFSSALSKSALASKTRPASFYGANLTRPRPCRTPQQMELLVGWHTMENRANFKERQICCAPRRRLRPVACKRFGKIVGRIIFKSAEIGFAKTQSLITTTK